jgi:hypothetical protein
MLRFDYTGARIVILRECEQATYVYHGLSHIVIYQ